MNYANMTSLMKVKNKPNLSQNKANSNPICRKAKIDAKCVFTKGYEENAAMGSKKQSQNKPNSNPISKAEKRTKEAKKKKRVSGTFLRL